MADKPTVLVLEGCRNFRPADARRLQPIVVRLLPRSVVRAVAGRLEIVVFGSLSSSSIAALTGTLGVKLAAVELVEEPEGSLEQLLSTYRRLLDSSQVLASPHHRRSRMASYRPAREKPSPPSGSLR